jgi:trk system potassium uptake protein TrkH
VSHLRERLAATSSASLEALRERLDRAFAIGPGRLSAALVLTMGLDLALFQEPKWHQPMTLFQGFLFLVSLGTALRRDLSHAGDHAVRRYLYLGLLSVVALIALEEKWWISESTDLTERLGYAASYRIQGATATVCAIAAALGRGQRFARFFAAFAEHPARQMALSFVVLSVFGAFLLSLPLCVRDPSQVSFVDALFMATSAVCVTGLSVHSIAHTYTQLGQAVLLFLIQVGGLGIMVLSASLSILAGRRLRAKSSSALAEMLDADSVSSLRGSIMSIVGFTLLIESLGTVALYGAFQFHPEVGLPISDPHVLAGAGNLWWAAAFHAVSGFCNAGFALTRDNLVPFTNSPAVCGIIMLLITLGGIGFPVLSELSSRFFRRALGERPARLSLHTRIALLMSATLTFGVALLLLGLEWRHSLSHLNWPERALAALFQSVTLRTAGFNTVSFADFSSVSLALCCLVMFVGAAPGGTGGGIKVTTVSVLFATFRAELRGQPEAVLLDRRLGDPTVRRAVAVACVAAMVLTVIILALLFFEPHEPLKLVFEAVSAFTTAGIAINVTENLSMPGRLIIALTMLIGRVGPLTLALAATERVQARRKVQLAQERLLIG